MSMVGILGHPAGFSAGMNFVRRLPATLRLPVRVAFALAVAFAPGAAAEQLRSHFDADSLMRPPGFFDFVVLGEAGKARWLVLTDANPPSAPNRVAQVEPKLSAGSIAAALRRNATFQDGTVSTFVRRGPGHAGMVVRMKDEKTFLLLIADTTTGEVVLSSWAGGKSSEIGRGQTEFANPWQKLAVRLNGPEVAVSFGDKAVFDAKDPKPQAGRAGLATEGPGEASFDEFVLDPTPAAAK
jgi:hypothetical protein